MYKKYTQEWVWIIDPWRKIWLTMRLTTFILLIGFLHASATGSAQEVTIKQMNISLKEAFREVKKQTGYNFLWAAKNVKDNIQVSGDLKEVPLEEALSQLLNGLPLSYTIEDKTILIKERAMSKGLEPSLLGSIEHKTSLADTKALNKKEANGRVVDGSGNPLPGATVKVKGEKITVRTNEDGRFSIPNVDTDAVLLISYLGYNSIEVQVRNLNRDVVLQLESSDLDVVDVVSTGYQNIPKSRSAGSYATVSGDKLRERMSTTNVLDHLEGLIPGLTVNHTQGADKLLIRGLSSINANRSPLIVVDGLPLEDVSFLNANDVASVTVLKDATAASIWGSRAANGVIVITTRKGSISDKLKVNYNGFVTLQGRPNFDYHRFMDSGQFVKSAGEIFDPVVNPWSNMSQSYFVMPHELIKYDAERGIISEETAVQRLDSLSAINNRQEINDLWVRNSILSNHNLSFSNGNKAYRWYASMNYVNRVSNTIGEKDEQFKVNLRQDFTIGKRIDAHIITDLSMGNSSAMNPFRVGADFLPYQLFKDASGNPLNFNYTKFSTESLRMQRENETKMDLNYVPLDEMNYGSSSQRNILARTVAGLKVDIIENLQFEGLYGYVHSNGNGTQDQFEESFTTRYKVATLTAPPATTGGEVIRYLPNTGGIHTVRNDLGKQWTIRNQLNYVKENQDHYVYLLAGHEAQEHSDGFNRSRVFGYHPQMLTYANVDYSRLMTSNGISGGYFGRMYLQDEDSPFLEEEGITRFVSYYTNGAYAYKGKYLINASWRMDESNLFGKDRSAQSRPVWSVGGKWNVGDEGFMTENSVLDNLSLRLSYGIAGNSPNPGTSASFDIITGYSSSEADGGMIYEVSIPGNPGLTWESTKTINMGLDFAIKSNVLSGSFDYYNKRTTDLIGVYPVNMLTGQTNTTGNLGDIHNKGFEISLNSRNIQSENWDWSTSLILSYNKNKLIKLQDNIIPTMGNFNVGFPAYSVFGYNFIGLNELGDPLIRLQDGTETSSRVVTTIDDWIFKGTAQPIWNGGFNNRLRYKDFSLNTNVIFNLGHVMRRDIKVPFSSGRLTSNIPTEFDNRWKVPGDELHTDIPSHVANTNVNSTRRNTTYYTSGASNVLSASFVKLREIGLSYSVNSALTESLNLESVRLNLQVNNVLLWKNNKYHIDPEFNGITPIHQNSVSFGLSVGF